MNMSTSTNKNPRRFRDLPDAERPYRAPRGTIMLGVFAAGVWLLSAILGFQQFGLPTVLFGLALAYSGAALYAWRVMEDRHRQGLPLLAKTLHLKLTGAMLFVLILDGIAYLMAVNTVPAGHAELVVVLEDIFVVVALLTISVGLVLPGMITYSAQEVSAAAKRLTWGTLHDFSLAMRALGRGDLEAAHASVNIVPVKPNSGDELGEMADSFNMLQEQVRDAAFSLDEARETCSRCGWLATAFPERSDDVFRVRARIGYLLTDSLRCRVHDHDACPRRWEFSTPVTDGKQMHVAACDCECHR